MLVPTICTVLPSLVLTNLSPLTLIPNAAVVPPEELLEELPDELLDELLLEPLELLELLLELPELLELLLELPELLELLLECPPLELLELELPELELPELELLELELPELELPELEELPPLDVEAAAAVGIAEPEELSSQAASVKEISTIEK